MNVVLLVLGLAGTVGGASLSGTVVDGRGARIASVTLVARSTAGVRWQTVSNAFGEFHLEVPSGRYQLRFAAPGFVPKTVNQVKVAQSPKKITLRLAVGQEPACILSVHTAQ